tara:strand:+ start:1522 stop:2655 length:1134 start_codon:yes stop_codon:yes gene_type:complete
MLYYIKDKQIYAMPFIKKISCFSLILIFTSFYDLVKLRSIYGSEQNIPELNYLSLDKSKYYILGSGDQISISIIKNDPLLNLIRIIDNDGTIDLPEIERIYISGLTIEELKLLLESKYKNILKKTDIKINLLISRNIKVYVQGEVVSPGFYTFSNDNNTSTLENREFNDVEEGYNFIPTLYDAIKEAGGITRYSDLKNVEVIRKNSISNGGGKIKTDINLFAILRDGDNTQNIKLRDGDIINLKRSSNKVEYQIRDYMRFNINPKFINIYITGNVKTPGLFKMLRNSDLNTAINLAGGASFLKGSVFLHRYELNGELKKKKISYNSNASVGSKNNPYLTDGDIIHIGENPFSIAGNIVTEVTRPFVGIYSTIKLFED